MNKIPSWTLGRTMISSPPTTGGVGQVTSAALTTALGKGNYNALFVTYRMKEYHGVSLTSNFTWSRAMGTAAQTQASSSYTAINPYNLNASYGPNSFDTPLIFNVAGYYRPGFYKTQKGIVGHVVGGWTFSPLFFAQSGTPIGVTYSEGSCSECQAFGEDTPTGGLTAINENAVRRTLHRWHQRPLQRHPDHGRRRHQQSDRPQLTCSPTRLRCLRNSASAFSASIPAAVDTATFATCPTFNVDAQALKDIGVWKEGRVGATLSFQITNVLNHMQPSNPTHHADQSDDVR